MSINWASVAKVGLQVAGANVPQVNLIEQLAKSIPGLSGAAKENAAVDLAKASLESVEGIVGKKLLDDPAIEAASRSFIQAYVALQNAIVAAKGIHKASATQASAVVQ